VAIKADGTEWQCLEPLLLEHAGSGQPMLNYFTSETNELHATHFSALESSLMHPVLITFPSIISAISQSSNVSKSR